MCKAKELQKRIDELQKEVGRVCSTHTNTSAEVAKLQADIFVASTQLAEISTRRIVWLTVGLFLLTAGLFIYTILLYHDAQKAEHRAQEAEHDKFQASDTPKAIPTPVNSTQTNR